MSLSENEMDSEDDDLELSIPLILPSTTSKLSTQKLVTQASHTKDEAETNSSAEEDNNEYDRGAGGDMVAVATAHLNNESDKAP